MASAPVQIVLAPGLAWDNGYFTHIDLEVTAAEKADVTETPTQIGNADDSTHRNLP